MIFIQGKAVFGLGVYSTSQEVEHISWGILGKSELFSFLINLLFIYLFWLRWLSLLRVGSSCGERGLLFVVVHGFLIAVASLVAEHSL